MIKKDNKSFCLAPWMAIHTWPDGRTFPCCLWDSREPVGNVNESSLSDIWNSDKLKDTRLKMIKGEEVKECSRCTHLSTQGLSTYRDEINSTHKDKIGYVEQTNEDGSMENVNLHLLDLRLSNFCNFKCRSCAHALSSTWYSDTVSLSQNPNIRELGEELFFPEHGDSALVSVNDKVSFLDLIEPHYKCVDEVYFAGGEPLMMPEHYTILDNLIKHDRTDVLVRYSTNFSNLRFKKKHIFEYWKKLKKLQIWISTDGVGKIGEYVRKGYNDKTFTSNINELKNSGLKPTDTGYMVTYGVLNYLHLFDMIIEFIKRDYVDYGKPFLGNKHMHFNPISYPDYYDTQYLPDVFKYKFYQRLLTFHEELLELGASNFFVNNIMDKLMRIYNRSIEGNFDYDIMNRCRVVTVELDKLRDEKFYQVLPYFPDLETFTDNSIKIAHKKFTNETYLHLI